MANKPPFGKDAPLQGEFAEALAQGRRLDPSDGKDKAVDPAMLKLLQAAEGEGSPLNNPLKGGDQPAGFEFKGKGQSPKK